MTIQTTFCSETNTQRVDIELWKKCFNGECEFFRYNGKYYFIQTHHEEMADVIKDVWEKR